MLAGVFLVCAIAVLFPPLEHGAYGTFEGFGFVFTREKLSADGNWIAYVSWSYLAAELLVIVFGGLALGFSLSSNKPEE